MSDAGERPSGTGIGIGIGIGIGRGSNAGDRHPRPAEPIAAIVLAGGAGSRMGGVDKPRLELGGSTLLVRAVAAAEAAGCAPVAVVGREVGGGPVAALAAGLERIPEATGVLLLAGDLVHPDLVVARLRSAADGPDGVVLVDPDGREQWLAARYRAASLRTALEALGDPADASLRRLVAGLDLARTAAPAAELADVDTWQDYERAKEGRDG